MSFLDTIRGVISRRVLLNYRIDPETLQQALPAPFRPKLYRGSGIGGVCMIRFRELRPRFLPSWTGRHQLVVQQGVRWPGVPRHLQPQHFRGR